MRASITSAIRAGPALSDLVAPRAAFVCSECLRRATIRNTVIQRRGYASKEPLTERIRKRIWSGEAPGPENVYGEPRLFPTKQQKLERQKREQNELQEGQQELKGPLSEAQTESSEELVETGIDEAGDAPVEAYTVEQAREIDNTYTPAEKWDGLKAIGGASGWWEATWDKENRFVAFRAPQNPQDFKKTELFNLIRQAYIEAHVLVSQNIPASSIGKLPIRQYLPLHEAEVTVINGQPSLATVSPGWSNEIVDLVDKTQAQSKKSVRVDKATETIGKDDKEAFQSAQKSWSALSLDSLPLRFAVIKRVIQLTGARISDSSISEMKTLGHLIRELEHRSPPKTTATNLNQKSDLVALPNVHIYTTRQTWVDKEKHLGRYKTIVNALKRRRLRVPHRRGRNI